MWLFPKKEDYLVLTQTYKTRGDGKNIQNKEKFIMSIELINFYYGVGFSCTTFSKNQGLWMRGERFLYL